MAKVTTVDFDAAVKPQNSSIYIGPKEGKKKGGRDRERGRKAAFENGKKSAQSFLLQCEKY